MCAGKSWRCWNACTRTAGLRVLCLHQQAAVGVDTSKRNPYPRTTCSVCRSSLVNCQLVGESEEKGVSTMILSLSLLSSLLPLLSSLFSPPSLLPPSSFSLFFLSLSSLSLSVPLAVDRGMEVTVAKNFEKKKSRVKITAAVWKHVPIPFLLPLCVCVSRCMRIRTRVPPPESPNFPCYHDDHMPKRQSLARREFPP